jgi:hypothetical protein
VLARVAFAGFLEFAQDPGGFLLQSGVDFLLWRPPGRTYGQTIGTNDKSDGAALGASKNIGDRGVAQAQFPVGLWVGEMVVCY